MARVLVVEDNAEVAKLLELILRRAGYDVDVAEDGLEALTRFREYQPDLVLLDIMLPGINGWEVCRRIKGDPHTAGIPVFILTVRSMLEDEKEFHTVHPDVFINKPFSARDLLKEVTMALEQKVQA